MSHSAELPGGEGAAGVEEGSGRGGAGKVGGFGTVGGIGGFGAVGSFGLGHSGMEAGSGRSIDGIETETKLASSVCDIINQLDQTVMSPLMLKGNDT